MNREEYIEAIPKEATYLVPKINFFRYVWDLFKPETVIYPNGYLNKEKVPKEEPLNSSMPGKKKGRPKKQKGGKILFGEKFKGV